MNIRKIIILFLVFFICVILHKCYTLHTNNREDFYDAAAVYKSQREANLLNADGYITDAELEKQKEDNKANGSRSNYKIYLDKYNDKNDGFNTEKTTYTINFNFKDNSTPLEKQRYLLIFLYIFKNTTDNIKKFSEFGGFTDAFDLDNDTMASFQADKATIFQKSNYVIPFNKPLDEDAAKKIENIFKIIKMETERLFYETNYPEYIDDKVVIKLTKTMKIVDSMTGSENKEGMFNYIMSMIFIPTPSTRFIKIVPDDNKKDISVLEYYISEDKRLNGIKKRETGQDDPSNRYLQIDISGEELTITKYNTHKFNQEVLLTQTPGDPKVFMIGSKPFQKLYFDKSRFNSVDIDNSVSSLITLLLDNYNAQQKNQESGNNILNDMKNENGNLKPLSEIISGLLAMFKEETEKLSEKYDTPLLNLIKDSKLEGEKLCVISLLTKNDAFKYPRKCSDGLAEPGSNGAAGSTVSVVDSAASAGANGTGGGGANGTGGGANGTGGGANGTGGGANGTGGGANGTGAGANGTGAGANGTGTTINPQLAQMKALLEGQLTPILTKIDEIKESQSDIKETKLKSISNNKLAKEEEVKKAKEKHDALIEQIEGLEASLTNEIGKGEGADTTVIKSLDKMLSNQTDELSSLNSNKDDDPKLKALHDKVHESHNLLKSQTNQLTKLLSQPKTENTSMEINKLKNSMLAVEKVMENQTMNISNTVKKSQNKQLSQLALMGQMTPMLPMSYSSNSNITPVRIIFTTLNYNNTDISKLENSIRISMKEVGVRDVDVPIEFKSGSIIANIYPNTEEDASIIKRMHIEIKKRVLNNNLKGLSSNIDNSHHTKLNRIIESIEKLNPKTMDDKEFERLKPRLNQLDNLDKEKLLGLLDSTLAVDVNSNNSKDLQDIVSYTKKLIASKSNLNSYNTNENNILLQEFKTAIRNKTLRKLTKYDRDILMSTPDSQLWKQIIYLNKKYSDQNPYDTTYVPGYVYMPPDKWETRREIPKCINDKAPISSPAFVFGSGVPSNALEFDSKLLPRFSYREEGSGVFTDDEKFNKEYTNSIMEETDRERLVLSASNTDKYVEKVRTQHSKNHRFDDYNL